MIRSASAVSLLEATLAIRARHSSLLKALRIGLVFDMSLGSLWPEKGDKSVTTPSTSKYSQKEPREPSLRLIDLAPEDLDALIQAAMVSLVGIWLVSSLRKDTTSRCIWLMVLGLRWEIDATHPST